MEINNRKIIMVSIGSWCVFTSLIHSIDFLLKGEYGMLAFYTVLLALNISLTISEIGRKER